ncbi:MAG: Ig-like domain-containing protein, partial [Candidatus Heimdallarchaeota archaeon]
GFDLPTISLTASKLNNSLFESKEDIDFSLVVTDSSEIKSVTISLGETVDSLTLDQGSGIYSTTVSTKPLSNGTYNLIFRATDVNDNTDQVIFVFEIGVYTSNIIDKAISDNTRNILIVVTAVVLVVAVIVTRYYMKSS